MSARLKQRAPSLTAVAVADVKFMELRLDGIEEALTYLILE